MKIAALDGYELFSRNPKASKLDGWREIVRDERALVRSVMLNMGTLKNWGRVKLDFSLMRPEWSTFKTTQYYREMVRYLDTRMVRKYRAYWELFLTVGADNQSRTGFEKVKFVWSVLIAETIKRKHGGRDYHWARLPTKLGESDARKIYDEVLRRYEELTIC